MHTIICIFDFMNFMLFIIKFIKVKPIIKIKKFEQSVYLSTNRITTDRLGTACNADWRFRQIILTQGAFSTQEPYRIGRCLYLREIYIS